MRRTCNKCKEKAVIVGDIALEGKIYANICPPCQIHMIIELFKGNFDERELKFRQVKDLVDRACLRVDCMDDNTD
jgi:hypothetical protein